MLEHEQDRQIQTERPTDRPTHRRDQAHYQPHCGWWRYGVFSQFPRVAAPDYGHFVYEALRLFLAHFAERSGVDRNRAVVDDVIPPRQSNGARPRDTKALCGYDSRKPVWPVGTVFFPEPVTDAGPGEDEWRNRTCERVTQDAPQR